MIFIQTKWNYIHVVIIALSVGSWFALAYMVTSVLILDYEWFEIWSRLMKNGNFWLGSLLIVVVVLAKDLYLCGLQRNFDPNSPQIIQELTMLREKNGASIADEDGVELQSHSREVTASSHNAMTSLW